MKIENGVLKIQEHEKIGNCVKKKLNLKKIIENWKKNKIIIH